MSLSTLRRSPFDSVTLVDLGSESTPITSALGQRWNRSSVKRGESHHSSVKRPTSQNRREILSCSVRERDRHHPGILIVASVYSSTKRQLTRSKRGTS